MMIKRTNYHRKGSVIVMVVGLLVLLAMIGSTFIIIAHMDRRESASIATVAPMKQVAGGVLQQIRAKLAEDLHIDAGGVIYGSATDYSQQVDYPHEGYDRHLASFAPVDVDGDGVADTWRHISNHNSEATGYADVAADDPSLVDTDGYRNDGVNEGDAKLFDSFVSNRSGQKYYVSYRLIDASSLMNINSAYSTSAAAAGTVMPITNISLEALTNFATRNSVHAARCGDTGIDTLIYPDRITEYNTRYVQRPLNPNPNLLPPPPNTVFLPFDAADMLALVWGNPGNGPNTASGRLWEALGGGGPFDNAKPYLTTLSASRDYVRQVPAGVNNPLPYNRRIDINDAGVSFENLFNAFYNAIPLNVPGFSPGEPGRRAAAAQLAVNLIDYRDADNDVTVQTIPGPGPASTVFGIERQPFITEAWLRLEWVGDIATGGVQQWSAIELFNPYKTAVSLTGYKLKVGAGATNDLQNLPLGLGNMLLAGERIVIVSSSVDIQAAAGTEYEDTTLDLRETCTLFRPVSAVDSTLVPVGLINSIDEFGLTEPDVVEPPVSTALRRDDAVARAKYSVARYQPYDINAVTYYTGDVATCPTPALTNLGRSNVDETVGGDDAALAALVVAPTPVFVRNGPLINLGEISRIFFVGPTADTPLDKILLSNSPDNVSNGRLDTLGAIGPGGGANTPDIPPICMLGDYMDAIVPSTANTGRTDTIYGRININTAPWQVIQYLPGISALTAQVGTEPVTSRQIWMRERVARDIVAYREFMDNSAAHIGGHDYSTGATPRFAVTGLTDLREEAGFASPGEVAIPLARIATPMPNDNPYDTTSAPDCYRITVGDDGNPYDDGLDDITDDLSKHDIYYSWLSNQITVRSDVYIAYIGVFGSSPDGCGTISGVNATALADSTKRWRDNQWRGLPVVITSGAGADQVRIVQLNDDTTLTVANWTAPAPTVGARYQVLSVTRRYIAVIDRSNCTSANDLPKVVMFAEMK